MSPCHSWTLFATLIALVQDSSCRNLPNATHFERLLKNFHSRAKRSISQIDRDEILQLHNHLRGEVYPSSSNMEYMEWDYELERSAESWAQQCIWDHGPSHLLKSIGQNLAVHWGRYRSPASHVQAWYDEVKDYTYPYAHECNPWCPERCSGAMCTHYTQLVWATTNRVGCAVNICGRMNVWGEIWENAVYLVCNYSPKGNWIGEAPYRHGRPCSECPPSYGGGCKNNICYKDNGERRPQHEQTNEVEPPQINTDALNPWTVPYSQPQPQPKEEPNNMEYMTQVIKCETKMRDRCKGTTCNRYLCPKYCESSKAKVIGTLYYETQSSICRAAIHQGIISSEEGGLVDITRRGKIPFFVKSSRNGIQSLSKFKSANGFSVSKVTTQTVDCYTTVAQLCPFRKPATHCPRINCPPNCLDEFPFWARVIGNKIYSDRSSICRTAVHAGVIKNHIGGLVDVKPVEKKNRYTAASKNGIQSESIKNPPDGKAFRIFAVA
ncbi:cysteine-rich secretory protein LCCL domain-containing 2 [Stegostoma tigrinum]|uniref:cysteine-rich secretory protein LCCL domain-containing 2 n=1 Tax=Stegostoma tigrinum TaxID=3053191 RepID=UPI00202B9B57|nr:cysteine-rich secretory protein LCCL domain-containing 2 [Stegostoma tigrinum]XP_048402933.1 cysteine-rich secretory protein LCCL domain-containing 2 [Stegostoma tigrinum]